MRSRIDVRQRTSLSLQSPVMALPPTNRPLPVPRESAPWLLPARLGGIVACSTVLMLGVHWLAAQAAAPLSMAATLALVIGAAAALVAQLSALIRRLRRRLPLRPAESSGLSPLEEAGPPPAPASSAPAGALRLTLQQLLDLQTRLLHGLPGPAMLLRPSATEPAPWQLLSVNELARAALPTEGSVARDRILAELARQAGAPGERAQRIDLPDGSLIIWLPPTAAAEDSAPSAPAAPSPETVAAEDDRAAIVYTVSHDLRAPIRVIEGFTRIVREDYGHLLDRVGNDHLERIMGAATRMNGMIDALLALSRLSTQPLQSVGIDLSDMARQIVEELRQQAPHRRVDVTIADGLQAQGDPALLRIVLDNLIGNAWKYSSRKEEACIEIGRGLARERQAFFVRDNGAGFDMRFASRLFGAFQRLHGATEFAGTGVGLASVRRIVRRHGGDIWAEAAVNQGATFWFTLD